MDKDSLSYDYESPLGRCPRCKRPLDDHEDARPCGRGIRTGGAVRRWLKFDFGRCSYCGAPRDDHEAVPAGLICP